MNMGKNQHKLVDPTLGQVCPKMDTMEPTLKPPTLNQGLRPINIGSTQCVANIQPTSSSL